METEGNANDPDFSGFDKNLDQPLSEQEKNLIREWSAKQSAKSKSGLPDSAKLDGMGAEMFSYIENQIKPRSMPLHRFATARWMAAASVALILIAFCWFQLVPYPEKNLITYQNTTNRIQKLRLSDGTAVWLNKNTTIQYPEKFEPDSRNFYLKKGEAFFQVERDVKRPFHIKAPDFEVHVLGTSFNIKVLENIPISRVTVASGQVKVSNGNGESGILTRDDELEINKQNGKFSVRQITATDANSWRSGQIFLEDVPFRELIRTLEETYSIKVSYPHTVLDKQNASFRFDGRQPLNSLLEIMSKVYNLSYKQQGKEVTLELNTATK